LGCFQAYIYTTRQLKLLRITYRDLHDWNRRKAAQDAIDNMQGIADDTPLLDDKFKIMERNDPIPLVQIRQECEADSHVRTVLHRRLNYFESLAVGVNQAVLD
jgi:hypothetical protein